MVKVNGQRMTCADVARREQQLARVARERAWTGVWGRVRRVAGTNGAWRHVAVRVARAREAETSAGAWRHV